MRWVIHRRCCVNDRIRQQAGSHKSEVWTQVGASTRSPVGDVRGYEGMGRISDDAVGQCHPALFVTGKS